MSSSNFDPIAWARGKIERTTFSGPARDFTGDVKVIPVDEVLHLLSLAEGSASRPNLTIHLKCRYCPKTDMEEDIYVVIRSGEIQGFCLADYEKYLDDKRKLTVPDHESARALNEGL